MNLAGTAETCPDIRLDRSATTGEAIIANQVANYERNFWPVCNKLKPTVFLLARSGCWKKAISESLGPRLASGNWRQSVVNRHVPLHWTLELSESTVSMISPFELLLSRGKLYGGSSIEAKPFPTREIQDMKAVAKITLVVALFTASAMLTSVSLLGNYDGTNIGISFDELTAGQLDLMFASVTFWSNYPSLPRPMSTIDLPTLLFVGSFVAPVFYVLRYKIKQSMGLVSLGVLIVAAVPYLLGLIVLHVGVLDAIQIGDWIGVMVRGVLYSSLAAAAFATCELTRWHIEPLARLSSAIRDRNKFLIKSF